MPRRVRCAPRWRLYRTFDQDSAQNRAALAEGLLEMPVAALGANATTSTAMLEQMLSEFATTGRAIGIYGCGHWIPEERPDIIADLFRMFTQ